MLPIFPKVNKNVLMTLCHQGVFNYSRSVVLQQNNPSLMMLKYTQKPERINKNNTLNTPHKNKQRKKNTRTKKSTIINIYTTKNKKQT